VDFNFAPWALFWSTDIQPSQWKSWRGVWYNPPNFCTIHIGYRKSEVYFESVLSQIWSMSQKGSENYECSSIRGKYCSDVMLMGAVTVISISVRVQVMLYILPW